MKSKNMAEKGIKIDGRGMTEQLRLRQLEKQLTLIRDLLTEVDEFLSLNRSVLVDLERQALAAVGNPERLADTQNLIGIVGKMIIDMEGRRVRIRGALAELEEVRKQNIEDMAEVGRGTKGGAAN